MSKVCNEVLQDTKENHTKKHYEHKYMVCVWIPICILALIIAYIISKKEARPYYIIYKKDEDDTTLYLTYSEYDDGSEDGFNWCDDESKAYCFDSFEEAQRLHITLLGSTILKV